MNHNLKLTSVRLQMVININIPEYELFVPVLRFGLKKTESNFPIVFCDEKPMHEVYDLFEKMKGSSYDEVVNRAKVLFKDYKKYDYRIVLKKELKAATKKTK